VKTFTVLLFLVAALGSGCQSTPVEAEAKRTMFVAGPTQDGRLLPRSKFLKGESPVIYLVGYGGQTVVLEMTRMGETILREEFFVPGGKTYQREGVPHVEPHFGTIRMVKRTEYVTTRGDAAFTFKQPFLGFYQATLKIDGRIVESARFSVLASITR
jgi:hypothetical protein